MNEIWKNLISTVIAAALISGVVVLVNLRTDVTVNTQLRTSQWETAKAQHEMFSNAFDSHESRIRLIENNIYSHHGSL